MSYTQFCKSGHTGIAFTVEGAYVMCPLCEVMADLRKVSAQLEVAKAELDSIEIGDIFPT